MKVYDIRPAIRHPMTQVMRYSTRSYLAIGSYGGQGPHRPGDMYLGHIASKSWAGDLRSGCHFDRMTPYSFVKIVGSARCPTLGLVPCELIGVSTQTGFHVFKARYHKSTGESVQVVHPKQIAMCVEDMLFDHPLIWMLENIQWDRPTPAYSHYDTMLSMMDAMGFPNDMPVLDMSTDAYLLYIRQLVVDLDAMPPNNAATRCAYLGASLQSAYLYDVLTSRFHLHMGPLKMLLPYLPMEISPIDTTPPRALEPSEHVILSPASYSEVAYTLQAIQATDFIVTVDVHRGKVEWHICVDRLHPFGTRSMVPPDRWANYIAHLCLRAEASKDPVFESYSAHYTVTVQKSFDEEALIDIRNNRTGQVRQIHLDFNVISLCAISVARGR